MANQQKTPLFSKLVDHISREPHSLHVPGHKWGSVFPDFARKSFESVLKLDATELNHLDDLHDAQTVIEEAQQLLADVYRTQASFFLVGGSTVGNLAMLLSVCQKDDAILVQRDSHKSVINGIQLAQAKPIYLPSEYDKKTGLSTGVGLNTVIKALQEFPEAKAIFLTNPSYYGITRDLKDVIKIAHQNEIPVLVDEAHGAHFGVGEGFPSSAITQGADIVVQSAHKTLPAMTMGSYLHVNSRLISNEKIKYYLQILQSSSPSYPVMASLDLARHYVANLSQEEVATILESSEEFKSLLKKVPQISVIELSETTSLTIDPLKITLRTNCELTGIQIQSLLEEQGIFVELANEEYLLLVLPLAPFKEGEYIASVIQRVLKPYRTIKRTSKKRELSRRSIVKLTVDELDRSNTTFIGLEEAVGRRVAEPIIPYPPGVPLLIPGETITQENIEMIIKLIDAGTRFQGHANLKETGLKVFITDERKEARE
ncbi:aminotransferase class I/II-fold pyridoxal phosphate-dependent enzyme [Alkalihalobacterium elongatum]|uniref:aminotransferase class I/II-fold pyridoxal phosphate-dependent enzyme n=1 Tax=Alkalihalobacterium elongatum TaxID=2675466 RepID=UPI001C1FBC5E|nr:aminotransferase class I/II-fold pyridoxal phosphate-dependent enzyme [Alkalihalobacterium elongatum]